MKVVSSERIRAAILALVGVGVLMFLTAPAFAQAAAWSQQETPNGGTEGNVLSGVSCTAANSCMAVGHYLSAVGGTRSYALAEAWDGTSWKTVTVSGSKLKELTDVSCVSSTSCVAVGRVTSPGPEDTVAYSWNGSIWSIQETPNGGTEGNVLSGVSCTAANSCMAVGHYLSAVGGTRSYALAEAWDGTSWKTVTVSGSKLKELTDVSCVSSTSCVAVGRVTSPGPEDTVAYSWNGSIWSIQETPNGGTEGNVLSGVSCTAANSCMAVGHYLSAVGGTRSYALAEAWDGTSWKTVTVSGSKLKELTDVSCVSSTSCVAVGRVTSPGPEDTVAYSWNGSIWSIQETPNGGTEGNVLSGVSCTAANSCMAVGHYLTSGISQTLAERYQ